VSATPGAYGAPPSAGLRASGGYGAIEGVATSTMTIQDDNAPLKHRGSYCFVPTPLRCPSADMYAYMSDGYDYARMVPYFRDAYVWGQDGDDDVVANGSRHVEAWGGRGNDSVTAVADWQAEAWGEGGDDVVTGVGEHIRLHGGGDRDTIRAGRFTRAEGGPGNDHFIGSGQGLDVYGQTGADTIDVDGARFIDGGSNNDTITSHAANITGNWGNDRIDVTGNTGWNPPSPSTVTCGPASTRSGPTRSTSSPPTARS
jgi:hypothetical protein